LIATLATDGVDGPTEAAGALVDGTTLRRAQSLGLDASEHLRENDSYSFFSALGDALITGPTGTNVNDISVALIPGAHPDGG
jgi:glycerate 2-kinase